MGKTFQIMTFDGGGIRGSLVVALLKRLQARFPDLLSKVDLFAGTSTGSAIALSLAFGKSTADLEAFYSMEHMKFVFGKSPVDWPVNFSGASFSQRMPST